MLVFYYDKDERKGYNTFDYSPLLNDIEMFSNSLIIFDDNWDKLSTTEIVSLYAKDRHANIEIICTGHTVTDLKRKTIENAVLFLSHLIIHNVTLKENKKDLKMILPFYRFKHYKYGIIEYDNANNYYVVLDKDRNVVRDSRVGDLVIDKYLD